MSEQNKGLSWPRLFGEGDPYDSIKWEKRTAEITNEKGKVFFKQNGVEVPEFWSQNATNIVASKYFRGKLETSERENSIRQMVDRVVNSITAWGLKDGYFAIEQDAENFRQDLKLLMINQCAAFNSPVWFNVGVFDKPQCSACFILNVEDDLGSILGWYSNEGWIFKGGSGSGANLSHLRSSYEFLSGGGQSSGPVSFMKGADGVANIIRSGGRTRRAAKMVVLNVDHPDIIDFIDCKMVAENMVRALEAAGFENSLEGGNLDPYTMIFYQNANNSVRVTDEFMRRVEADKEWELKAVTTGTTIKTVRANELMDRIANAAWHSADPGMQFDTTINHWHTLPNSGRINASNPCSEYMSIDDSACNLASLNLMKFLNDNGTFDVTKFKNAVDTIILAQEIIVDNSSYPTPKITMNARAYRQLGLGYTNLGSLLMNLGLAYDSDDGRTVAAAITSIMHGEANCMSARMAEVMGPFSGYTMNREEMLRVMSNHGSKAGNLADSSELLTRFFGDNYRELWGIWEDVLSLGQQFGYRNSQVTVLAPTGTISFLMDCDTTGIEPELALVKQKKLVGGGTMKLVNHQVAGALKNLKYPEQDIKKIIDYVDKRGTIEGAPHLKPEHLPIFDCSFKAQNGVRSISYLGHIKMMGAVQPFISGAISKTVNLPSDATVEDIRDAFIQSWKHGLKAIAVYRDGCKSVQPLNVSNEEKSKKTTNSQVVDGNLIQTVGNYTRRKLPVTRNAITHKFSLGGHEGYLTVGLYTDGTPGETFIVMAKEGSTVSGLVDTIATLISVALQSGVPLKVLVNKFKDMRFEPAGITENQDIRFASSIVDYIFKWLGKRFLSKEDQEEIFGLPHDPTPTDSTEKIVLGGNVNTDAPTCGLCGTIMNRAGSCYTCPNCANTTGSCD
ncbi:MAG: vitamin B12-dependent ribonucleotide reductase [Candidatus Yanofskybacteria bacterium]|nr:vitamin B12-dependent ribonucleotide reductase [Candidatus Yanofskybacteria bacterium]